MYIVARPRIKTTTKLANRQGGICCGFFEGRTGQSQKYSKTIDTEFGFESDADEDDSRRDKRYGCGSNRLIMKTNNYLKKCYLPQANSNVYTCFNEVASGDGRLRGNVYEHRDEHTPETGRVLTMASKTFIVRIVRLGSTRFSFRNECGCLRVPRGRK